MPVSLDKFNVPGGSDGVLVQPKLAYRFRVVLSLFGGGSVEDESLELTSQVISVSRPSLTHDDVVIDVYNSRLFLAGKHTWDPVTLTVRDDVTGKVAKAIGAQLQNQIDHANQSGLNAGTNYKFAMAIENLDGSQPGTVLDRWELGGCYIQNVNYGENNYSTSDALQITLTIKYDNAQHTLDQQGAVLLTANATNDDDTSSSGEYTVGR